VVDAAKVVLEDCNVPVRKGVLKKSGHVEEWPLASHGTVGASVVFDAPHAHLVHELPAGYELHSGEDKWLEKASQRKREQVLGMYSVKMGSVLNDD
jgi:hypothetical protein